MNGQASGLMNHPTGGLAEGLSDRPTYKLTNYVNL